MKAARLTLALGVVVLVAALPATVRPITAYVPPDICPAGWSPVEGGNGELWWIECVPPLDEILRGLRHSHEVLGEFFGAPR